MKIPLFKVFNAPEVGGEVSQTLYSGYVGQGPKVQAFESALAEYLNNSHVLALNSGTSALQLALHLIKGDAEAVLTTPLTCFATTAAILQNGLKPKWVDVDLDTCNMCLDDLEMKLDSKSRIIVLVHFAGNPINRFRLHQILLDHQIKYGVRLQVIEDCAHAFGAEHHSESKVGSNFSLSDDHIYCFSFQAVKTLNTGDGGAIVLPNQFLYNRAKKLRWFGLERDKDIFSQDIREAGFKYQMNDIAATIGLCNLKHVDTLIETQRANLQYYYRNFSEICFDRFPRSSGWVFPVRIRNMDPCQFEQQLAEAGIEARPAHYRNDVHYCVKQYRTHLPNMDTLEKEMTCIPSGWWVGEEEREIIKERIRCVYP